MESKGVMYPKARTEGVLVEEVGEEAVLYDASRQVAHSLNATALSVWRRSDGQTSTAQLAEMWRAEHADAADEIVSLAVDQLAKANLLEPRAAEAKGRVSRRDAMRRLAAAGVAAVMVPAVMSVAAPTPAMAQSAGGAGGGQGSPCRSDNDCGTGLVCIGGSCDFASF